MTNKQRLSVAKEIKKEVYCGLCITEDFILSVLHKYDTGTNVEEIERLKKGDFTEEEFQNLCHTFNENDKKRFCNGCELYQIKLFGSSPITKLRKRMEELEGNKMIEDTPDVEKLIDVGYAFEKTVDGVCWSNSFENGWIFNETAKEAISAAWKQYQKQRESI